jgi:hypothetical protein
MNIRYTKFEMPTLKIDKEELVEIICKLLSGANGLDFNGFLGTLANHLLANQIGFDMQPNTDYCGSWQMKDKALVREIFWDFIIDRYLSPGGNGHDEWPSLTVTQKGKDYFSNFK